jgi:hypothetical protein
MTKTSLDAAGRAALIASFGRLWHGWSDFRFGQMLREVVGEPAIRRPADLPDSAIYDGVARALREAPGPGPLPGPYWDTESRRGQTFTDGLTRDPARIPRVLDALSRAWDRHPSTGLGELIEIVLDRGGVDENEYRSRLLLIEDGHLRRLLDDVAT